MVVGAGLSAGRDLAAAGVDVVVVEAQDRVGGRVFTDQAFANFPVERGAEFLHGIGQAAWTLAEEAGAATLPDVAYDVDSDLIVFLNGARQFSSDLATDEDLNLVFENDALSIGEIIASLGLSPLATQLLRQDAALEQSGDVDAISAFAVNEEVVTPGGDFRLREGYSRLPEYLSQFAPIYLSTAVTSIDWSGADVVVHTTRGAVRAQRVLTTVSIGVLKAGAIQFTPPIPADKQDAIDGLGMGFIAKILMCYDRAFWPDGTSNVISDGDPQLWWMPGAVRDRDDLDAVIIGFASNTFEAHVAGMTEAQIREVAAGELARVFGSDADASHLVDFSYQDWKVNEWVRGGYSYVRVGRYGARPVLAAAVSDRLFFAGEATDLMAPTTSHGAVRSGARAAQEILATLGGSAGGGGAGTTRTVHLLRGLNLVGWTGDTAIPEATASIAGLFSQILGWDAAAQAYVSFIPGLPAGAQGLADLNTGDAFWIVMDQAAAWEQPVFSGPRTVSLLAGCNLAMWTGPTMAIDEALAGLDAADALFRWNGTAYDSWRRAAPVGNTLTTLNNGDAFFIRLTAAATWEQPAP